ncbi:hypothetical protein A0V01_04570 (plasmid) [Borrelia hermsii]|uniref:Uncharacterized protein n=2 Tax=Borrelia hermsii TaxID=140 RepID=A0AAN0X6G7_BORHE|nr:hypothetical protein A0V01_04570 [Borrelia hermsii]ANA43696.1 hypothetical protein AXX13_A0260 [Borrelia hermsii HS1]
MWQLLIMHDKNINATLNLRIINHRIRKKTKIKRPEVKPVDHVLVDLAFLELKIYMGLQETNSIKRP